MKTLNKIIQKLNTTPSLRFITQLSPRHKNQLLSLEEKNNLGVREALSRQHTILLSHNSLWRKPAGPIVKKIPSTIFPPVPFPEIEGEAKNIVSSSPSSQVHYFLMKEFNLALKQDEATLLLGFDLP